MVYFFSRANDMVMESVELELEAFDNFQRNAELAMTWSCVFILGL